NRVYVPSARPPTAGVVRYTGPFPTSATAKGGCGGKDATGAPMATSVKKEQFIGLGNGLAAPIAIVRAPKNDFYVSSVISGVINEYDANGGYVRTILQPPADETLGATTFSTGTPLGLGVGPDGTLYYADVGIGSAAFHGPMPAWGRFTHDLSIATVLAFVIGYDVALVRGAPVSTGLALFGGLAGACALVLALLPDAGNALDAVLIAGAIGA